MKVGSAVWLVREKPHKPFAPSPSVSQSCYRAFQLGRLTDTYQGTCPPQHLQTCCSRLFLALFASLFLLSFASAQTASDTKGPPLNSIDREMIEQYLDDDIFAPADDVERSSDEIQRARALAQHILAANPGTESKSDAFLFDPDGDDTPYTKNYPINGMDSGITITIDPKTGWGIINGYDSGFGGNRQFDIAVPTILLNEPKDETATAIEQTGKSQDNSASAGRSLEADNTETKTGQFRVAPDPEVAPTLLTAEDFNLSLGYIDGFWQVGPEIWHIVVDDFQSAEALNSKADIQQRLESIEDQLAEMKFNTKVYTWRRFDDQQEVINQTKYKRLDIEIWEYLGENTAPDIVPKINTLELELATLNDRLAESPADKQLDPTGFEAMAFQGAHPVQITAIEGDCSYKMSQAYFDGRTLGAKHLHNQRCTLNKVLPETIKSQLLSDGHPKDSISVLRVTKDPRSGDFVLKGQRWSRKVHHDIAGTKINRISGLQNLKSLTGRRLTPQTPSTEELCQGEFCNGRSCEYNTFHLTYLFNRERLLEQYLMALIAEEQAVATLYQVQLGNSKRSSARLEAARFAASLTAATDEVLAAVVELNGIVAASTDPSTLSDPLAMWELLKDVSSIVNRIDRAQNGLNRNIESIHYDPALSEAEDGVIYNFKKNIEDAAIDYFPDDAIDVEIDIPHAGTLSSRQAIHWIKELTKKNTSNAVDALGLSQIRKEAASSRKLLQEAKTQLRNAKRNMRKGDIALAASNAHKYAKLHDKTLKLSKGHKTKAAFNATQIIARLVSTHYSSVKLQAFRDRIQALRGELGPVVDNALTRKEDLDRVRLDIRTNEKTLARNRAAKNALLTCMSDRCGAQISTIALINLPELEKSPTGALAFGKAKRRLENQLEKLEIEQTQFNQSEASKEAICLADQTMEKLADRLPQVNTDGPNRANCTNCQSYAQEANALEAQIGFLSRQTKTMSADHDQMQILQAQRRKILRNMSNLQKEYIHLTDGSYTRRILNLTDSAQRQQADIHNDILRLEIELQAVKRNIAVLEQRQMDVNEMAEEAEHAKAKLRRALELMYDCERQFCAK